MRKIALVTFFLTISIGVFAQNYQTKQLQEVATIWGETYLFHPSIIRSDKSIEWEKNLIEFLPLIKNIDSNAELIQAINTGLLSKLNDPFTLVQSNEPIPPTKTKITSNKVFDYLEITEDQLSDIGNITIIDSIIEDRVSDKPMVVDLRINKELGIDWHSNTLFDYFASMLINCPIPASSSLTREHFGWDEYNDWWYYEQRWTTKNIDKQLADNGLIKPYVEYAQEMLI